VLLLLLPPPPPPDHPPGDSRNCSSRCTPHRRRGWLRPTSSSLPQARAPWRQRRGAGRAGRGTGARRPSCVHTLQRRRSPAAAAGVRLTTTTTTTTTTRTTIRPGHYWLAGRARPCNARTPTWALLLPLAAFVENERVDEALDQSVFFAGTATASSSSTMGRWG
jgi:hypothetical protein